MSILIDLVDEQMFFQDFNIDLKHDNTLRLKQRFRDIKMLRNKYSHCQELEAKEIYDIIRNLECIIELFKEGRDNPISLSKAEYLKDVNKLRLFIMDRMVKEEMFK